MCCAPKGIHFRFFLLSSNGVKRAHVEWLLSTLVIGWRRYSFLFCSPISTLIPAATERSKLDVGVGSQSRQKKGRLGYSAVAEVLLPHCYSLALCTCSSVPHHHQPPCCDGEITLSNPNPSTLARMTLLPPESLPPIHSDSPLCSSPSRSMAKAPDKKIRVPYPYQSIELDTRDRIFASIRLSSFSKWL